MATQYRNRYEHLRGLLLEGRRLSYSDAERELQCKKRTVERLLQQLERNGLVVQKDTRGKNKHRVFFMHDEDRKAYNPLSEKNIVINTNKQQLFALLFAAKAAQATFAPTPLGPDLHDALAILRQYIPTDIYDEAEEITALWDFSEGRSVQFNADMFWDIVYAIRDCECMSMDYYTASKGGNLTPNRVVEPHRIIIRNGSWILIAHCHKKQDWREFALAGIQKLRRTGEFFINRNLELDAYLGKRFNAIGDKHTYRISLLVEPDRVPYFGRKVYHPSQRIEHREDGRAMVYYTVDGLKEMRSFVQGWGTGVTVIEPPELVEIIKAEAQELVRRYNTVQPTELEQ